MTDRLVSAAMTLVAVALLVAAILALAFYRF